MPLILNITQENHFNTPILTYQNKDFYILNDKSRKIVSTLFDCLGNISSYDYYYAFLRSFRFFGTFKKCFISNQLKFKLKPNEGIIVLIDTDSSLLYTPCISMENWFISNYSKYLDSLVHNVNCVQNMNYEIKLNYKQSFGQSVPTLNSNISYSNEYPFSEDEMTLMPIYKNNFTLNVHSNKISPFFNFNWCNNDEERSYSGLVESNDSVLEPNESIVESDKSLVESNDSVLEQNEPIVRSDEPIVESDEPIVESNEPIVRSDEPIVRSDEPIVRSDDSVLEQNESIVESDEPIVESNEPIVRSDKTIVESNEPIVESDEPIVRSDEPFLNPVEKYNLYKEIYEKHNQRADTTINDKQQNGYGSRLLSLFGWK